MERWTADQVTGLAPDTASVAAGRKQSAPGVWTTSGCDDAAVWGSAQGSGSKPYQVAVDLSGPAYKCSCPSRKIPCKHVLGLLLRWAEGGVTAGPRDAYVEEWLQSRAERAGAAQERAVARAEKEADPAAQAKRADRRAALVTAGCQDLDRWLADLVRQGLAAARERPASAYEDQARRLVDGQAPALAARVRRLGQHVHAGGEDWPVRALVEAGRLHVAARAWRHTADLPGDLREDVRALVGWSRPLDEVRRDGPALDGSWAVVGLEVLDDGHVRTRRTWLLRETDRRPALLLAFSAGPGGFGDAGLPLGALVDVELRAFPGRSGLRVVAAAEPTGVRSWSGPAPEATVASLYDAWGAAVAADPFCERLPVALHGVVPVQDAGRLWVRDEQGAGVPLDGPGCWELLAAAGGRPVGVTGVFDGVAVSSMCVSVDGATLPLPRPSAGEAT